MREKMDAAYCSRHTFLKSFQNVWCPWVWYTLASDYSTITCLTTNTNHTTHHHPSDHYTHASHLNQPTHHHHYHLRVHPSSSQPLIFASIPSLLQSPLRHSTISSHTPSTPPSCMPLNPSSRHSRFFRAGKSFSAINVEELCWIWQPYNQFQPYL